MKNAWKRSTQLSTNRKRLLELMSQINFGRIEGIVVRGGEPLFDPPPFVVREIKFGGETSAKPELGMKDFILKSQVLELFERLDDLGDGTVGILEVKHGLPFRMSVEEQVRV